MRRGCVSSFAELHDGRDFLAELVVARRDYAAVGDHAELERQRLDLGVAMMPTLLIVPVFYVVTEGYAAWQRIFFRRSIDRLRSGAGTVGS